MVGRLRNSAMQDLIRGNGFGPFRHCGREFLRRIFVSVRDRNWQEISPTQWNCTVNEPGRGIRVVARHTSELVDFEWHGRLQWSADARELSFDFEGRALRTMEICRLGLVVLHPIEAMTGAIVTTRGPGGQQDLTVPNCIAPQPVVNGIPMAMTEPFSAMAIEHPEIGRLEVSFTGDLFELEDQRNWGDASFKTYCTPLRLGFPRTIDQGSRVAHRFEAALFPAQTAAPEQHAENGKVLRIGRMAPASFEAIGNPNWVLGWDHIRINLGDGVDADSMQRLFARCPPATMLEIGMAIDEATRVSADMTDLLNQHGVRVSTLILRDLKRPLPTAEAVARVRQALRSGPASRIPLLASPNGYFVEFNRNEPFELDVDGIAFPVSSTVHADDADTILANVGAVGDMIAAARRVTGKSLISISPLALYLRKQAAGNRFPQALIVPWLTSIVALGVRAGVDSITLSSDGLDYG